MRMARLWIVPLLFALVSVQAEGPNGKPGQPKGGPDMNPNLRSAQNHERVAALLEQKAEGEPNAEVKANLLTVAANFKKMAEMKREGSKALEAGKPYDWKAYQELRDKNAVLRGQYDKPGPKRMDKPSPPKLPPEMKKMPENVNPVEGGGSPTTMKTSSGFEIRTHVGQ